MFLFKDLIQMIQDINKANNKIIGFWGKALNLPQILGGLLLMRTLEGAVILLSVIFTLIVASQIHKRTPFSRLIGICHLPWLGLTPWLIYRLQTTENNTLVTVWLYYVVTTMLISIFFDIYDLVRFSKGAKSFSWGTLEKD